MSFLCRLVHCILITYHIQTHYETVTYYPAIFSMNILSCLFEMFPVLSLSISLNKF